MLPMSDYRRARVAGGCYFFTVVTYQRRTLFGDERHVDLLRQAFAWTRARHPFNIEAIVILPDHLHCVWRLPEGDADFSGRWRAIKQFVSRRIDAPVSRRGEKTIWQRRFWEHLIRDEEDWQRHVDYIHFNPVKHGLVNAPEDWPYSSYGRAVDRGCYQPGWGRAEPDPLRNITRE
jgi:putative transposase